MTDRKPPDKHLPRGAPTKFKVSMLPLVRKLAAAGLVEREIADCLEISRKTLTNWKVEHPKFALALVPGKRAANRRVEASLYHRAIGYTCPDTHVAVIEGEVVLTPLVKHYPPSEGAMTLWLTNRDKKRWKSRQSTELSTPPGQPLEMRNELLFSDKPSATEIYKARLAAIARDNAEYEAERRRQGRAAPSPEAGELDPLDELEEREQRAERVLKARESDD